MMRESRVWISTSPGQVGAPGAPGDLHQLREQALGRAEIRAE